MTLTHFHIRISIAPIFGFLRLSSLSLNLREAIKYHVVPLDNCGAARLAVAKPSPLSESKKLTPYEGFVRNPDSAAPSAKSISWSMKALVEHTLFQKEEVINPSGGLGSSYAHSVKDDCPRCLNDLFEAIIPARKSVQKLADRLILSKFDFPCDGGDSSMDASFTFFMKNEKSGETRVEKSATGHFGIEPFMMAEGTGLRVTRTFEIPIKFQSSIRRESLAPNDINLGLYPQLLSKTNITP